MEQKKRCPPGEQSLELRGFGKKVVNEVKTWDGLLSLLTVHVS